MKKTFLLLTLLLGFSLSYSQYDCSQGDGTFRYEAKLYIENVANDFDKEDLINHIIELDPITNEDLATLNSNITSVYKTFPSQNPHTTVTIVATIEIFTILDNLNNSIELPYCVINDCRLTNGTFPYYALLTGEEVPNDFDKSDFIDFIVSLDEISNADLTTLETNITSLYKAFPSSISEFLQRVVYLETDVEIYPILASLSNSIEHHSCIGEVFLDVNEESQDHSFLIFPNPITENSVLQINYEASKVTIEILNSLGQMVYSEKVSGKGIIELKNLPLVSGIYFVKINDLQNGVQETFKIVKGK